MSDTNNASSSKTIRKKNPKHANLTSIQVVFDRLQPLLVSLSLKRIAIFVKVSLVFPPSPSTVSPVADLSSHSSISSNVFLGKGACQPPKVDGRPPMKTGILTHWTKRIAAPYALPSLSHPPPPHSAVPVAPTPSQLKRETANSVNYFLHYVWIYFFFPSKEKSLNFPPNVSRGMSASSGEPLCPPSPIPPPIRHSIHTQEAGNALVTLGLRMLTGGDGQLFSCESHARFLFENAVQKTQDRPEATDLSLEKRRLSGDALAIVLQYQQFHTVLKDKRVCEPLQSVGCERKAKEKENEEKE
ncbi:hypothetical protein EVAR_60785_1 [Eumeta japonica]|uniref:Uncharacterized protein n=1 Tax=Eumeta variegata TaxID=151549 RepID=A0A4C1ZVK5_EUMVA|nr:hypothetical protein EVAR_60785_1 [Eumeta japonica]